MEGDNTSPRDNAEPDAPAPAGSNPIGDGEDGELGVGIGGDEPLNTEVILERFRGSTVNRFKPGARTPDEYVWVFRRFASHAALDRLTRRQVAARGRELILSFMATVPLPSKRKVLCGLECVWTEGLGLAWPVNTKRDFGKTLPPVGGRESPKDSDIRPWADADENEKDPYAKLLVLIELNYGWRPENQLAHARWRWVRHDEAGRPYAFVTRGGADEGFKTHNRIVAYIPPAVADALEAWNRQCPRTDPEAYILPRRYERGGKKGKGRGVVDPTRQLNKGHIDRIWRGFEKRWGLSHLPPVYLRHWVKTTCRRLSDPALAALQGHQPPNNGSMRNVYDTPTIDAIIDEQRTEFPHGALGALRPPPVKVVEGLEPEIALVKEWKAGRLGTMELVTRLEAVQRRVPVLAP